MILHKPLWSRHPHVRSGDALSVGERAADTLKRGFGSWPFLILLNVFLIAYVALSLVGILAFDPFPFILLNLGLSWLAAQQGGALQIAANRGDRIASELALSTHDNGMKILAINEQQLAILTELKALRAAVSGQEETDAGREALPLLKGHSVLLSEIYDILVAQQAGGGRSGG